MNRNFSFSLILALVFALMFAGMPWYCYGQLENNGPITVFSNSDSDKVQFEIVPVFHNMPLVLNDQNYVDEHGDTLKVEVFRFYITNVSLLGSHDMINSNAHLYDAEDSGTHAFTMMHVPPGVYTELQFLVGVDSAANTSGANEGDLDQARGMYWAWNSGYIMAKLQGTSGACKTLHHAFEFHIGGYQPPYNAARLVTLKLPGTFAVGKRGIPVITIKADVAAWFGGNLDLAKVNNISIPGKDASQMADRYAKMFSVDSIDFLSCKK